MRESTSPLVSHVDTILSSSYSHFPGEILGKSKIGSVCVYEMDHLLYCFSVKVFIVG